MSTASKHVIADIQAALKSKAWQSVIDKCQASLELRKGDVRLHLFRAYAHDKLAQLPEAEAAYRAALELEASNAQALQGLAQVQFACKAWAGARATFSAAAEARSTGAVAAKLMVQGAAAAFHATQYDEAAALLARAPPLAPEDAELVPEVRLRSAAAAVRSLLRGATVLGSGQAASAEGASAAAAAGAAPSTPQAGDSLYHANAWYFLLPQLRQGVPATLTATARALRGLAPATARGEAADTDEPVESLGQLVQLAASLGMPGPEEGWGMAEGSRWEGLGVVEGWAPPRLAPTATAPLHLALLLAICIAVQGASGVDAGTLHASRALAEQALGAVSGLVTRPLQAGTPPSALNASSSSHVTEASQEDLLGLVVDLALVLCASAEVSGAVDLLATQGERDMSPLLAAAVHGVQGVVHRGRTGADPAGAVPLNALLAAASGSLLSPLVAGAPPAPRVARAKDAPPPTGMPAVYAMGEAHVTAGPVLTLLQSLASAALSGLRSHLPLGTAVGLALRSTAPDQRHAVLVALASAWTAARGPGAFSASLTSRAPRSEPTALPASSAPAAVLAVVAATVDKLAQAPWLGAALPGSVHACRLLDLQGSLLLAGAGGGGGVALSVALGVSAAQCLPPTPPATDPLALYTAAVAWRGQAVASGEGGGLAASPLRWLYGSAALPDSASCPGAQASDALSRLLAPWPTAVQTGDTTALHSTVVALPPHAASAVGRLGAAVAATAVMALSPALLHNGPGGGVPTDTPAEGALRRGLASAWGRLLRPLVVALLGPATPPATQALLAALVDVGDAAAARSGGQSGSPAPLALQGPAAQEPGASLHFTDVNGCLTRLATACLQLGQGKAAEAQATALAGAALAPCHAGCFAVLGHAYAAQAKVGTPGAAGRAEACWRKALALRGDLSGAAHALAAHLLGEGRPKDAASALAAFLGSSGSTAVSRAWAALALGQLLARGWAGLAKDAATPRFSLATSEELAASEGHLHAAGRGLPLQSQPWECLAQVYLGQGKLSAALKTAARALALWHAEQGSDADSAFLQLDLAPTSRVRRWLSRQGDAPSAPAPGAGSILLTLAEAHLGMGQFDHALARAEAACAVDSTSVAALGTAGRAALLCARQAAEDGEWAAVTWAVQRGLARLAAAERAEALPPSLLKCRGDLLSCLFPVCPAVFTRSAASRLCWAAEDPAPPACTDAQGFAEGSDAGPPLWVGPRAALVLPLLPQLCPGSDATAAYAAVLEQLLVAATPTDEVAAASHQAQLCVAWCDLGRSYLLQARAALAATGGGDNSGSWAGEGGLWGALWHVAPSAMAAAEAAYRGAVQADTASPAAWLGLGLASRQPSQAQHALVTAVMAGGGGVALCNLGMLYLLQGEFVIARRTFVQAQHTDPANAAMWVGVGHLAALLAHAARTSTTGATLPAGLAALLASATGGGDVAGEAALRSMTAFLSGTDLAQGPEATLPAGLLAGALVGTRLLPGQGAVQGGAAVWTGDVHAAAGGGLPPQSLLSMAAEAQPASVPALLGLAALAHTRAVTAWEVGPPTGALRHATTSLKWALAAVARQGAVAGVATGPSTPALTPDTAQLWVVACATLSRAATLLRAVWAPALPAPPALAAVLPLLQRCLAWLGSSGAGTLAACLASVPGTLLAAALKVPGDLACLATEVQGSQLAGRLTPPGVWLVAGAALAAPPQQGPEALAHTVHSASLQACLPLLLLMARLQLAAGDAAGALATLQDATRSTPDAHMPWRMGVAQGAFLGDTDLVGSVSPHLATVTHAARDAGSSLPTTTNAPQAALRQALLAAAYASEEVARVVQGGEDTDSSADLSASVSAALRESSMWHPVSGGADAPPATDAPTTLRLAKAWLRVAAASLRAQSGTEDPAAYAKLARGAVVAALSLACALLQAGPSDLAGAKTAPAPGEVFAGDAPTVLSAVCGAGHAGRGVAGAVKAQALALLASAPVAQA